MSKKARKTPEESYEHQKIKTKNDEEQESAELNNKELRDVFLEEKQQRGRW